MLAPRTNDGSFDGGDLTRADVATLALFGQTPDD